MLWVSIQYLLHSCLLKHYVEFTINRAMPPQRSAPANAATEWRIGPGTDPRRSSRTFAPRLVQRFFVLPRLFFVAWFLASEAVTASGSGNPAPLGSKTFCVPQKNQRLVRCIELNPFCSRFGTFNWFWPSSASWFARHSVRSDGRRARTSGESYSGRRSAPHTIRLLFGVGSSFCRLPCFVRAKLLGARMWVFFLFLRLFCLPSLGQSLHSRRDHWSPSACPDTLSDLD